MKVGVEVRGTSSGVHTHIERGKSQLLMKSGPLLRATRLAQAPMPVRRLLPRLLLLRRLALGLMVSRIRT
jgi:hypothetical protein